MQKNHVFAYLGLATCLVLLVPLVAMQFTEEVRWSLMDFIVMGTLLMSGGALFVISARMTKGRHTLLLGLVIGLACLYVWAELAVGLFFNRGS
ncbi:hypothetical protein G0Q06_05760 [Puniceicoccales bacterium CK1056]|uniref:Uncharacterized protein n=1 Tax=Oceanipulchritudo coccoides TaxID=2706888 RepID=A0A6B2M2K9_9BACT|nr:hypothetical protein [Oceanipulchritudo coccoides]